MEQLFDEMYLRIEIFRIANDNHALDSAVHIEAKDRAIDALNDYIDARIEEARRNNYTQPL